MTIRTLIVDDEPLGRERLRSLLEADPAVTVVGECADGREALAALRSGPCDLVFLDVEMPGLGGLEVARRLGPECRPVIVFVTAHGRYALPAFEVHAADYLLKPFDRGRFQKALEWAKAHLARRAESPAAAGAAKAGAKPSERITVKSGGRIYFLKAEDVDWVEAAGNYLRLHVGAETHLLRETLSSLEARLDPERFWRIHRSTLVNADRVQELQPLFHGDYAVILRDGTQLTLSRSYRQSLPRLFGGAP
jgi:two-component system LytT family response regulator